MNKKIAQHVIMNRRRTWDDTFDDYVLSHAYGSSGRPIDIKREYNGAITFEDIINVTVPKDINDLTCYLQTLNVHSTRKLFHGLYGDGIKEGDTERIRKLKTSIKRTCDGLWEFLFENTRACRKYSYKIADGKWCNATSIFLNICTLVFISNYIDGILRIKKKKLELEEIKEMELLMYDKEISQLNQLEIQEQIRLLAEKWKDLVLDSKIIILVSTLLLRVSEMIVSMHGDDVLNGLDEIHRMAQSPGVYACTPKFIDDMSCYFADFVKSIKMKSIICDSFEKISENDQLMEEFEPKKLGAFFVEWLEKEVQSIVNQNYKDNLKNTFIIHTLYCGEYQMYMRDTGIETESATSIIDQTRNPLEVTWWVSDSIPKSAGIRLRHNSPFLESVIIAYVFNNYCKSIGNFKWDELALIMELNILSEYRTLLTSKEPVIVQCMGSFVVIYDRKYAEFYKIEEAIIFWFHIMAFKNQDSEEKFFIHSMTTYDFGEMSKMYENIKKEFKSKINQNVHNVHKQDLEDKIFFANI